MGEQRTRLQMWQVPSCKQQEVLKEPLPLTQLYPTIFPLYATLLKIHSPRERVY